MQADAPTGMDIDVKVPQEQNPTRRRRRRSARDHDPASGLLDQSERRRRQDHVLGCRHADRHAQRGDLPGVLQGRVRSPSTARPCRRRSRGGSTSATRSPATSTGSSSRPAAGARNFKFAGPSGPIRTTGQLTVAFEDLPQSPLTEFNMHFFGSERGLLATPTQCGEYPVESEFVPWDSALPPQRSTSSFSVDLRPERAALPERPAAILAALQGRSVQHDSCERIHRSPSNSTAKTANRTSRRSTSPRPRASWRP